MNTCTCGASEESYMGMQHDPECPAVNWTKKKPRHETQKTISDWAVRTFGDAGSNLSIAVRANEEMAEMLACLSRDDDDQHAAEEAADVIITLCRLFERLGVDIVAEVDRKMRVNRERTWRLDGNGHGYHT